MDEIDEQKEMEQALSAMSPHQRDHLKTVIRSLIQCYLHDDRHALVLTGSDNREMLTIISVNADDIHAANLLAAAETYINFRVMEEAPPKEMFN